ncbi:MAG TPA: TonB-dependent receptor plug domain-containing protein [Gemmatimonadales bacterium]
MKSLALLAALGCAALAHTPEPTSAQAPTRLRVRAVDSAGAPIPYASITLSGVEGTFSTDLSGWTIALRVGSGPLELSGRAIGYLPATLRIEAAERRASTAVLRFAAAAVRLEDLEVQGGPAAVRAEFYQRVRRFGGRVVTREAIERSGAINPLNALGTTPGIRILQVPLSLGGPTLRMSGCNRGRIVVAIDGREVVSSPVSTGQLWYALDQVRAFELDLIEVYQHYDQIPPLYRHPGICGALLLWTTQGIRGEAEVR